MVPLFEKYPKSAGTIEMRQNFYRTSHGTACNVANTIFEERMMRYLLLWILGVPIPVLILIWLLWGH